MPRKKIKRPNWPYRFAWLVIVLAIGLYIAVQTLIGAATVGGRSFGTDWSLELVTSCLDATCAAWFFIVGASIGSFLNVVAFRLPLGRNVGGHSGCFYCRTPIRSVDNVPVLAWIKLRGRCRTCRLPISIQYPLVEFTVGLVFLFVYWTEVVSSGGNLPGGGPPGFASGLLRIRWSSELILRTLTYVMTLSGLIAAALIAVRRQTVPLKLYMWSLLPWVLAILFRPDLVLIGWRAESVEGFLDTRMDAFVTVVSGMAAGLAVARLLAPLLYPGFDRRLISPDRPTTQSRQFLGAMAVSGALIGWQSVVAMAWVTFLVALAGILVFRRFRAAAALGDMVVWAWLGMLLFRSQWGTLEAWQRVAEFIMPAVILQILGGLCLAPLAIAIRKLAANKPVVANAEDDNGGEDEDERENDDAPQTESKLEEVSQVDEKD